MQLIYRGTTFDYNPAHINARRSTQRSGAAYELIYRGNLIKLIQLSPQLLPRN